MGLNRTIWILWLQGWAEAPWLVRKVAESWEINNPTWNIEYLSWGNLNRYVSDAPYLTDSAKTIEPAAVSDIARLSLLTNHGGVWADATLLCMQPLDSWVVEAVRPAGLWMYHGHGAGMSALNGPASWFMASERGAPLIAKWKTACDNYWLDRTTAHNYFWLDGLFRQLHDSDPEFRAQWQLAPYLYCEGRGQSHCLAGGNKLVSVDSKLQECLRTRPPYVLKLWWRPWSEAFPDAPSDDSSASNGGVAISASTTGRVHVQKMRSKQGRLLRVRTWLVDRRYFTLEMLQTQRSRARRWGRRWSRRLLRALRREERATSR